MDPTNMDIRLVLAALEGGAANVELPPKYVESLFDSVAETYDDTILPAIAYNVPNELVTAVTKSMAFDCGCASGQLPANEWAVLGTKKKLAVYWRKSRFFTCCTGAKYK